MVVEYRQPRPHAVRGPEDVVGVHLVVLQLPHYILPHAGVVHQTDEGGPQLHIGDVLHHVAGYAAGNLLHPSHVAPAGDIGAQGIPFHIHKYGAQNHNAHLSRSFRCVVTNFDFYYTQASALRQRKRRKPQRELRSRCGFP